jgi:AAHS family 4-hydroxybenzoate transporter-like MFS transporter
MSTNEPTTPIDLGKTLDEGHWSPFQKWVLFLSALAFALDGVANQSLAIAIPSLVDEWGIPRGDFAKVAALNLIGVAIGTVIGGVVGDKFGRKLGLICSIVLFGVMTAAGALVSDVQTLMIVRFLDGLGIGGAIPSGAAIISEFTPIRRRSRAIAVGMVFIPVGGILAGSLGTFLLPAFGWRMVFVLIGAISVLVAVLFCFLLPESPRFLLRQPDRRAELLKLLGRIGYGFSSDTVLVDRAHASNKAPVTALLGPETRRDTLALWTAFFFCLMASYTLFSWIPSMLREIGLGVAAANSGIMAFHIGGTIGGFLVGFLIERVGSKASWAGLALGSVACAVTLAVLLQAQAPANILLVVLIAEGFFIAGIHTAVYTLAAHVYPPFIRATGVGSASAFGRIGAVLSSFTGVMSLDLAGPTGFFYVIAAMLLVCFVAGTLIRNHVPASGTGAEPEKSAGYERASALQR